MTIVYRLISLPCGHDVTENDVFKSDFVELLYCPECNEVVTFNHRLKSEIDRRRKLVTMVMDKIFAWKSSNQRLKKEITDLIEGNDDESYKIAFDIYLVLF